MGDPLDKAIERLRRRAHVHTDACYDPLTFNCADHHRHDAGCYERRLWCRFGEEPDLVVLFQEFDRMREAIRRLEQRLEDEVYDITHAEEG